MPDWYEEWVMRHATVFGMTGADADLKAMLAWYRVFAAARYTAAELHEATDWLTGRPEDMGRGEVRFLGKLPMHLAAIQRRIREQRAVEYRREEIREDGELGTCVLCGGTARVVVPHLAGVQGGEWRPVKTARAGASYYTMAVSCSCALGRWWHTKNWQGAAFTVNGEDRRALSLEEYQLRNPRWKIHLAQRQRQMVAETAANGHGLLAGVLNRLMDQYGLREEPGIEEVA